MDNSFSLCYKYLYIFVDVCVYKGVPYTQGQKWFDGCDFSCVCEDGSTGVYRCNNRYEPFNNEKA